MPYTHTHTHTHTHTLGFKQYVLLSYCEFIIYLVGVNKKKYNMTLPLLITNAKYCT